MGRNLSPILRRELANLDKDADSRKTAMKALKSYVKDLDSKAIPQFLAQVSETKGPGSSSGEYTISLYEVLARVHGRNIVPQIDNIMLTIVNTLTSSAGSFPLHQACSKVVPAIARYGIDPSTPEEEKVKIIQSLCKPLSSVLMGPAESVASGAALCLKALVESDNWRFASDEAVNDVCLRVAGALEEKLTQTNSHMGLVMALAKHNSLIVEAYARSLIRSGLQILTAGVAEGNSQRRLSAIQMINFLMKCIDSRSIFSELAMIVDVLEKCDSDQMPFVRGAAFEALQTARMIAADKGSKFEKDSSSITGSNFRRDHSRRNLWGGSRDNRNRRGSRSPRPMSPESHTVNSFIEYDSLMDSPLSTGQASCNFAYGSHANRKLWRCENGGVDVSLKDGLYSAAGYGDDRLKSYVEHFGDGGLSDVEGDRLEAFSGFAQASSPTNTITRSATPSPQRSQSQLNADDIRIFTTPRKLIRSLQDPDDVNSDFFDKQAEKIRSPASCEVGWEPTREMNGSDGSPDSLNYVVRGKQNCERVQSNLSRKNKATDAELELDGFESVSSTGDVDPDAKNCKKLYEARGRENNGMRTVGPKCTSFRKAAALSLVCGLTLILPAIILSTMWLDNHDEYFNLVPT